MKRKICTRCKETKNIGEFHHNKDTKDGFQCYCKPCSISINIEWRKKNPDKIIQYDRTHRKKWRKENPDKISQYRRKWTKKCRKEHPQKFRARNNIQCAIRRGDIKRQPCEECGKTKDIHAHHPDYFKPLDVIWLCESCHRKVHANAK